MRFFDLRNILRFATLGVVILTWMPTQPLMAQMNVDRVFPPVVSVGENAVTLEGKVDVWPCGVICDRVGIEFEPQAKSGEFKVVVANDVAPGVTWVRFHDEHSASSLVPLVVTPLQLSLETQELHSDYRSPQSLNLPTCIAGRLAKRGEVDCYRVHVNRGDELVLSVLADTILQSPMDTVLQITDTDGNVLAQQDDDRFLDPQLTFRSDRERDLVVRVFAFPSTPNSTVGFAGAASFVYLLRATCGPFLDHVHPILSGGGEDFSFSARGSRVDGLELQKSEGSAFSPTVLFQPGAAGWFIQKTEPRIQQTVMLTSNTSGAEVESLPTLLAGEIRQPKQVDRYRFAVEKGKRYRAEALSRAEGFRVDTVLTVINLVDGKRIARDDDISRTKFDTDLEFKASLTGKVELQVSDAVEKFGPRHVYAVRLSELVPAVDLSVSSERFAAKSGEELEISVKVNRIAGYGKRLRVSILGLPDDISAMPVVSEPKGDSASLVKLKLVSAADAHYQGNIRIQAEPVDSSDEEASYLATYRLANQIDVNQFWLTIASDKKDPAKK